MNSAYAPASQSYGPFEWAHPKIAHVAHSAILILDEQQRIVMINPAARRMLGCTATEALGSNLSRFVPPRYRAAYAAYVRQFNTSETINPLSSQRRRVVGLRMNGERFPAEATISAINAAPEFGSRCYFMVLLRDPSEGQGLKAEINLLKQRMRTIFELAPIAIWVTSGEHIVFTNHAGAALFGTTDSNALVGRSIYTLLRPESHQTVRQKITQALATDRPVPILSERIARLDGAVREVEIAIASLPDHGQTAVQMVITDITERARENQELARSRRELRRLSASLVNAREEERRHIARELHDELGQRLSALKMELGSLAPVMQENVPDYRIVDMLEMVDETVAAVRRLATDLRPLMLDDLGLDAAIEWLVSESARRMGIEITLHHDDIGLPLSEAASTALYRMVQEALTNIAHHAHATEVEIEITRQLGELVLTVQDNGVGFCEQSMYREGSHGLMGIRERAYMLGGQLEIGNAPKGGGQIAVRLPLDRVATNSPINQNEPGLGAPNLS